MKNFFHKFYCICEYLIAICAMPILFLLGGLALWERTRMEQVMAELMTFHKNGWTFWLFALGILIVLFLLKPLFRKITPWKLFLCFSLLYIAAGFYLIGHVYAPFRGDSHLVHYAALELWYGNLDSFGQGGYLYFYPHQLGLLTFERIILRLSTNQEIFFYLNLISTLINQFVLWKITEILYGKDRLVCNYTLLLSFLFLPQFFHILFVYGLVYGFTCLLIALWFWLMHFGGKGRFYWVGGILFLMGACLLRNNYMIAAIAIAILLIMDCLQKKKFHGIFITLLLFLTISLSGTALQVYYRHSTGKDLGGGIPKLLWVTMGLQGDEDGFTLGGWYNGYNRQTYEDNHYDAKAATLQAKEDLQERIRYLMQHPAKARTFFLNKLKGTWCEPTFQSIWSGVLEEGDQHADTPFLDELYHGNGPYEYLANLMHVWIVLLYLLTGVAVCRKKFIQRKSLLPGELFILLFITGGFYFHLIWETKSQYVYPYVYLLIPIASAQWTAIQGKIKTKGTLL